MKNENENIVLGAIICTIGYFFIAVMGACSKLVSSETSVATVVFYQYVVCFLFTLPQVFRHGFKSLKTRRWDLHLTRDISGILSFYSLFFALKSIPLVDAVLLQNTAPLWIPLVVLIWFRFHVHGHLWWGMILGFIGVILILKPGAEALSVGSFLALAAGVFLAIALVSIRRLATSEPSHRILFYYFLAGVVVSAPFVQFVIPSTKDQLAILGVGIFFYFGQLFITYSFKYGKASTFAPIAYTAVVFSGILGWLIWGDIPNLMSFIGLILVIIGGIASLYFENKHEKKFYRS